MVGIPSACSLVGAISFVMTNRGDRYGMTDFIRTAGDFTVTLLCLFLKLMISVHALTRWKTDCLVLFYYAMSDILIWTATVAWIFRMVDLIPLLFGWPWLVGLSSIFFILFDLIWWSTLVHLRNWGLNAWPWFNGGVWCGIGSSVVLGGDLSLLQIILLSVVGSEERAGTDFLGFNPKIPSSCCCVSGDICS